MSSSFDRPYGFEEQFPAGRLVPPPVQDYRAGYPRPLPGSPGRPPNRGQALSWTALTLAVLGALAVGFGIYHALGHLHFRRPFFADASHWLNLALAGLVVLVVAFGASVVALIRARPKAVAAVALVATLLLPVIGALIGGKFGLDVLLVHAESAAAELSDALLQRLVDAITAGDLLGALRLLLDWFLGQ